MAADFEYSLMAGRSYQSTRNKVNWFPVSKDWREIAGAHRVRSSGFEATAFRNLDTDEIVISFAGTGSLFNKDWWANFGLTMGNCVQQLCDAAVYYLEMKELYGNRITFTGHSLGGGIAEEIRGHHTSFFMIDDSDGGIVHGTHGKSCRSTLSTSHNTTG